MGRNSRIPQDLHLSQPHATRSQHTRAAGRRGGSSTNPARGGSRTRGRATTREGRQRRDHGFRPAGVVKNRGGQQNSNLSIDEAKQIILNLFKKVADLKNENVELNRKFTSLTVPLAESTIRTLVPGTNQVYVASTSVSSSFTGIGH